ncbi:transglutaminase, partial [candidate division GN15 bacterium]
LALDAKNLWVADYQSDRCYKLVIDDGVQFSQKDKRMENLEYVHQVRNFGPDTVTTLQVYLAVPQSLNSQTLVGNPQFTPAPAQITTDKWGQKIARFEFKNIASGQVTSVTMNVRVGLQRLRYYVFPEKVGKLTDIPADTSKKYLIDDVKFQFTSPVIQEAVKTAVGSETNPYWIARKIFSYVNDKLFYERVGGWNTAPTVLQRGNGSCSEYTFVYIAMCRAAGLPARYVGAVTHRGDDASWDDVFHRWVEVFLPNYGWIPIDPSGGDQPTPQGQAAYIGNIDNRFLITTCSGGGSEYLDWSYNANERWISKGKCKIAVENFGEWTPAE